MEPLACFSFSFSLSSSIPLRTRRWQEWHWRRHMKSIRTEATVSAPHILSFLLHIPNIRHVWLFQRQTTWCHLCASHICSLLLVFSVLSTPGLCGKCCVPLFCFCGGFVSLCLKDTSNSGQRDAWCLGRDRNGNFFALSCCHWLWSLFFIFSPFMENIIRQKKDGRHYTRVSAVCWRNASFSGKKNAVLLAKPNMSWSETIQRSSGGVNSSVPHYMFPQTVSHYRWGANQRGLLCIAAML